MEFWNEVIGIVTKYWPQLLTGVGYTMLIALVGTAAGFLIGLLTGVIRTAPRPKRAAARWLRKLLSVLITIYIEVFRGTPMMVQAMVIYWGYAFLNGGQTLPLIPAGLFIVSINTGAYMAEIVRGGIISVDKGQLEGAYSVGMTHAQAMGKVVLPQVLRNILPSISNEFVINIKDTSVLNVIGVTELYYMAGVIKRINLQTFQTYTVICVIYFILTFTVTRLLRLAGRRLGLRLAGGDPHSEGGVRHGGDFKAVPSGEAVRHARGAPRHQLLGRKGRGHQHHRLLRLRQEHDAALHQSAGNADGRADLF